MRGRRDTRDAAFWRAPQSARAIRSVVTSQPPSDHPTEHGSLAIRHVHLLFWGSVWESMAERRVQFAAAFQEALAADAAKVSRRHAPGLIVTASVISTAALTSPGDPPELLAHADVSALVANLMSKRALSPWAGPGAALYCVVLRSPLAQLDGRERFAYTAYRQNMRDVHCGWLYCQEDPEMIAECARKLLAEVEAALLTDAV